MPHRLEQFLLFGVVVVLAHAVSSRGQTQPVFEVVSIRPSAPPPPGNNNSSLRRYEGGRFTTTNADIRALIRIAYQVLDFQIAGTPGWIDSARFDIHAVPDREIDFNNPVTDPMPRMLQILLEDRFQLKLHRETKEMQIYALVVGKGGSKLQEVQSGDGSNWSFNSGPGTLKATNAPIAGFVRFLSGQLGHAVADKTGLLGYFDFTLQWTPDVPAVIPLSLNPPPPAPAADAGGPSIFTALQEQLGLRLESERGPVEILVIDSVQRPSEN